MNINRRQATLGLLGAAAITRVPAAWVQTGTFPSRPIRIVVPLAAGGSADAMCRLLANGMTKVMGQTVIVDNKPGAGGMSGMAEVAKAAPDGYTLGYSLAGALTVAPHIAKSVPYNALKDFTPLSQVVSVPEIIVVNPLQVQARTLKQFIAFAKANPGRLNFGSAGNATIPHLGGELLKREAGVDLVHVPYRGSGPALNDLVAGQLQLMVADITLVRTHIASGRLVALAVAGNRRVSELAAVPTTVEAGLPGMQISNWHAIVGPAGMPADVVAKLHNAMKKAMALPEVAAKVNQEGAEAVVGTPQELAAFLRQESDRWGQFVKALGIRWE